MAENQPPAVPSLRAIALAQAAYFIITGVWPLVSIRTFEMITGPKTDRWLVKTAGVLITAIGAALGVAGLRRRQGPEIPVLAVGSAVGLTAIDVVYVARGRISRVYLLDALAEVALILAWAVAWAGRQSSPAAIEEQSE